MSKLAAAAFLALGLAFPPPASAQEGSTWVPLGLPDDVGSVGVAVVDTLLAYRPADVGGFARSTDGGRTWADASEGLPRSSADPSRPAEGRLERVTASPAGPVAWAALYGGGAARSTDAGRTWIAASAGLPVVDSRPAVLGGIASAGPAILAAANGLGVYRSTDLGVTWADFSDGLPLGPDDPNNLYVYYDVLGVDGSLYTAGTGVWRRGPEDAEWSLLDFGDSFGPFTTLRVEAVQVGGASVLLAMLLAPDPSVGQVPFYRSTDSGDTWEPASDGLDLEGEDRVRYGFALSVVGSTVYAGTYGGAGLYRSDDGQTWTADADGTPLRSRARRPSTSEA